ncbi:imidazoleacetate 4-monooxygenase [Sarracenia purpurea var. burkii]
MEIFWYCLAALLSLLLTFNHFFNHGDRKLPPSPFALPIVGHLHLMIKNSPTQALQHLSSKHGPILFLRFGSRRTLVVSSPSAVEDCFTNNDVVFANRPRSMAGDCLTYNYTAVVWAPYGELWRNLRRLSVVELFSSKSLHKSSIIREEETRDLLSHLFRISCRGETPVVDLKYWFLLLATNMVTTLVTGERYVRYEDAGNESGKKLLERIKEMFVNVTPTNLCDFFPILRWIDYKGAEKSMMGLQKKRDEFLQGLVDEYRRKKSRNSDTGDNNWSAMIGTLLFLQESEPEFYTEDLVKSMILVQPCS